MATATKHEDKKPAEADPNNVDTEVESVPSTPTTDMVPATHHDIMPGVNLPADNAADFFGGFGKKAAVLHNFTGSPKDIWAKTARATGPTTRDADDAIGKCITLTHFYCHAVTIAGPTDGEIIENMPRIVLIDKDGTAWGFVSRGILDGLRQLLQSFNGVLPEQGIEIEVKRQKTRAGFHVFCIEPWTDKEPAK